MAAKVKCPVCGASNDKEATVQVGNRYCCKDCADQYKEEKAKRKAKPASPPAMPGYAELIKVVCEIFDTKAPSGLILKQIQTFRNSYNYTYDGIRGTILYCFKWSDARFYADPEQGLNFVPYFYEKARDFYEGIRRTAQSVETARKEPESQIINIDAEALERARFQHTKLIDIAKLT